MQRATSLPISEYQSAALQLLLEAHSHIRIPQPEQGATYEAIKIDRAKSAPVGRSTTKRCLEAPPQGTYLEGIEVTPASSRLELFDILTVVDTGLLILGKYLTAEHRAALACTCALGKEVTATEFFRKNLLFADCLKMTDDVFENLVIFRGFVFAGRHLAFSNLMDMSTGGNSEANKGSVVVEGVDAPGGSLVVVRAGALPVGTLEVYWPGGRRGGGCAVGVAQRCEPVQGVGGGGERDGKRQREAGARVGAAGEIGAGEQGGRGLRVAQIGVAVKGAACGTCVEEAVAIGLHIQPAKSAAYSPEGDPGFFMEEMPGVRGELDFINVLGVPVGKAEAVVADMLKKAAMQKVTKAMGEIDEARRAEKHLPPQVSMADVIKKLRVITAVHESVPNGYMPLSSPPLIGSGWLVHWGSHIFLGSSRVLFEVAKSAFPLASALPDDFAGHLTYSPNHCPDVTVLDAEGPGRHVIFDVAAAQPMADAHPWGGHDGAWHRGAAARNVEESKVVTCGDKTQRWFGGRRYMSEDEAKEEEGGEEEDEGAGLGNPVASVCLGFLKRLLDVGED
ncbi:hypothetical protein CYMTET_56394 [Cymbomonas tetramitiformis]|uniref:Uncharacterized protein n=1 Tax=Cymbomonas tetramitiformis TaxID=36881 RepID=A0AAE0BC73_9CHLO|nr:hypothetical protein CYMTET_56394 [Cymbomonas tetramitiformis]